VFVRFILVRLPAIPALLLLLLVATPLAAQTPATDRRAFGIGASIGLINDVTEDFDFDNFESPEFEGWIEYRLIDRTILRGSYGSVQPLGEIPEPPPAAPGNLVQRVTYWTIGTEYLFWEGDYISGVFGGVGLYEVDAQHTEEDTWGWHLGVSGDLVLTGGLSLIGRLSYHWVDSDVKVRFIKADAGLTYRF
jgi:hypothetical protein